MENAISVQEAVRLYTNAQGQAVTHGSYSARESFRYCPQQFKLARVDGWDQKESRASAWFGKAIEAAVEFFEGACRRPHAAEEKFSETWKAVGEMTEAKLFTYTDTEGDWESLLRAGVEMMTLYEIRAPHLPISTLPKARFQVALRKTIFPNSAALQVLSNKAYVDLISYPVWNHPMLVKLPSYAGRVRPIIIDIKTSGVDLETDIVNLDPQLAEYAWQARVPDVAFLWFVKRSHEIKKGSRVTMLREPSGVLAGREFTVLGVGDGPEKIVYVARTAACSHRFDDMLSGFSSPTTNIAKAAKRGFFETDEDVLVCAPTQLTKQRLQFGTARLSEQDMNESGMALGQTTIEMVQAAKTGVYPKTGGIRFPNQKCKFCRMRPICAGDSDARDRLLTRKGEEWLDGKDTD